MKRNQEGHSLDRKYRSTLAVAALILLGDQLLAQPYLARRTRIDLSRVQVEERQLLLSQKLTKAVLLLDCGAVEGLPRALEETKRVLESWESAHRPTVEVDDRANPSFKAPNVAIRPHFEAIRDASRTLIAMAEAGPTDPDRHRRELNVLLSHESEYLRLLGDLVRLGERAIQRRFATSQWIGWALTGLALVTLAAWGRSVLRPTAVTIRRLEDRVRDCVEERRDADRKHREVVAELSQVGRIHAVGVMALSLAHELNQPIGAIVNYTEGCLNAIQAMNPRLGEIREALERLLAAAIRAGRIVDQVRAFVVGSRRPHEAVRPDRIVAEAVDLLGAEVKWTGVAVRVDVAPDLPEVWGDPTQFQQVLVNLMQNALQAFTRAQVSTPEVVVSTQRCDPDHVEFAVTDNGPGIEEARLNRVFDLNFSTRADGMGVGLAICRTIADVHRGRLTVESEPGIRTIFRFQVPIRRPDHE